MSRNLLFAKASKFLH